MAALPAFLPPAAALPGRRAACPCVCARAAAVAPAAAASGPASASASASAASTAASAAAPARALPALALLAAAAAALALPASAAAAAATPLVLLQHPPPVAGVESAVARPRAMASVAAGVAAPDPDAPAVPRTLRPTALAIVGVSGVRIHDLGHPTTTAAAAATAGSPALPAPHQSRIDRFLRPTSQNRQRAATAAPGPPRVCALRDDPETAVAARLIPAVLLGALLGTERGALRHGLCVRTLLLVSSVSALAIVSGLAAGLAVPAALPIAMLAVATALGAASIAAAAAAAAKTSAAASRESSSRTISECDGRGGRAHINAGAATGAAVALSTAALGTACGAGLPLVAAVGYLLAVTVLRSDARASDALARRRRNSGPAARGRHRPSIRAAQRRRPAASVAGCTAVAATGVSSLSSTPSLGNFSSSMTGQPVGTEAAGDPLGPFFIGPRPKSQHQDQKMPSSGRTVLRLAMENNGGVPRIVEVAGSDLDDAIRELKRREWS